MAFSRNAAQATKDAYRKASTETRTRASDLSGRDSTEPQKGASL